MKKIVPIIIIVAVIALAIFVIFACQDMIKNNDNTTNPTVVPSVIPGDATPTPTVTPEPTPGPTEEPTAEPTMEPTAEPTVEPEATAEPTSEPTNTPEPTVTPTPTPTPTPAGPVFQDSGSFKSDTGTSLNLRADWSVEGMADGKYYVTVKVYLECYTISCSARTDASLVINGETISYNTEEQRYSDKDFHNILFTEYTFEAEKGENIDVEANWYFRGKYSGVPIDLIQAAGSFIVG